MVERRVAVRLRVVGVVQGVGFRPYVHRLATELGLLGWVANDGSGVVIEVSGRANAVDAFLARLGASPPPLAVIDSTTLELRSVAAEDIFGDDDGGRFHIRESVTPTDANATALVPADVRTCDQCVRELRDPSDRRYRHPFINCTDCGPRFTIVRALPYDRANTTMAVFEMCAACEREYRDPTNRRFHAEPICCTECGPRLRFLTLRDESDGNVVGDDAAIAAAVAALNAGKIVAVKGLGGYALAVLASNAAAVGLLRQRKHRDEKPFAVQVASVDAGRHIVELSSTDVRVLEGPESPILLARRRRDRTAAVRVDEAVAPGSEYLGVMLPSTALHHLLANAVSGPLVMTSGNVSDEPIAFADDDALERLADIADAVLMHDRPIHRRADDSVVRTVAHSTTLLRRARGYVPRPIAVAGDGPVVLGVGAELKSTVCFGRAHHAFVSTHLGDLEHAEAYRSFRETIDDLAGFLNIRPELIAHDLHPEYLSTKWALAQDVDTLAVQHHHAHIASCLAEHGVEGPVVGLAFDGHGYGPAGTLWGGEFLVADLGGFDRVGHLVDVPLPGGSTAIREPWRMAVAHLQRAYEGHVPRSSAVVARNTEHWDVVASVSASALTMKTSSMGRLFDAVASILGIRDRCTYEGQAAMALEQAASRASGASRRQSLDRLGVTPSNGTLQVDPAPFLRSLVEAIAADRASVEELAWLAHVRIAESSSEVTKNICARTNLSTVVLSGGVFQNVLLTELVRSELEAAGHVVLTHRLVPPNDGAISLGQVAIGRVHLARS